MSVPIGSPLVPISIEGLLIQLQRRLSETENQERGTGRRSWNEATILVAGATPLDNGYPCWRELNDGRIELRGRLTLTGSLAGGTKVLRLPGNCAPPGDGVGLNSWLSTLAPCSTLGTNTGVYRLDVERTIVSQAVTDPETGGQVTKDVIYADLIAWFPEAKAATGWIGFDHAVFDPKIYIDTLRPVPAADVTRVYGGGKQYDKNTYVVESQPGEFGIAIIGGEDGGKVATVPGVDNPDRSLPPIEPA